MFHTVFLNPGLLDRTKLLHGYEWEEESGASSPEQGTDWTLSSQPRIALGPQYTLEQS